MVWTILTKALSMKLRKFKYQVVGTNSGEVCAYMAEDFQVARLMYLRDRNRNVGTWTHSADEIRDDTYRFWLLGQTQDET